MDEDNDEDDNNGRGRRLMAASDGGRFHTQQSNEGDINHKQKDEERGEGGMRLDEGIGCCFDTNYIFFVCSESCSVNENTFNIGVIFFLSLFSSFFLSFFSSFSLFSLFEYI